MDVVTAKGEVLHCDEEQHSDLFWAARGAGPGDYFVQYSIRDEFY